VNDGAAALEALERARRKNRPWEDPCQLWGAKMELNTLKRPFSQQEEDPKTTARQLANRPPAHGLAGTPAALTSDLSKTETERPSCYGYCVQ
jgi:hypothetical protein